MLEVDGSGRTGFVTFLVCPLSSEALADDALMHLGAACSTTQGDWWCEERVAREVGGRVRPRFGIHRFFF